MASITLASLTKRFGDLTAVASLDLEIRDKEFVALLGPSGCGKTTTMNMIAGIETPSDGQILFDGRDMRTVPASRRKVGFVFQNYAIFTHLSVRENLAFGLKVRGVPRAEVAQRVAAMAPEFFDALAGLLGIPFETIVFGHGPAGDRASIQRQIAYYDDLTSAVRGAVEAGLTEDEAADTVRLDAYAGWGNYEQWFPLNVRGVYRWLAADGR